MMNNVKIHRSIARVNGIDLFYMDTQLGDNVILCLHGRWGRAETWVPFMQHYGDRYRVIAPDQRGHGLSSKPVSRYTAEEMAADIIALLDHLHIDSVLLVGHSMGGHIAGVLAAAHPARVKTLAILDKSAAGPQQATELTLEQIPTIDPLTKDWPLPFSSLQEARDFLKAHTESDLSYQYFLNSLVEKADGYHMLFSAQAMAANIAHYADWFDRLLHIHCPVLLIRAASREAVTDHDLNRMQALLPNSLAFDMSHPDHNVQHSNPEEFYGYFDQFLSRVEKR